MSRKPVPIDRQSMSFSKVWSITGKARSSPCCLRAWDVMAPGGLKALRRAGAVTIAQDRAGCVVYGMPKAAAEIGAAAEILPLEQIAGRIGSHFADEASTE